ncbi:alpha/beta hydrolase [Halomonas sp. MCCC 1A17488]|uniref:alpha/beta fold hydrolase n=1 Tax=unclassified Halomonas TaxID=2609666 RepID=UPI0018D249FD|nr:MULTISPECIES: alpha/beta hydrolase [unclassified Halomonas]MCE8018267.1 alpha/beta hydrolase [Halomonas sp. MCCC 1A17488]MCG3241600.1 alpha/beta hydrolase [Halomonas sp. MCCC 1A17488]QPP48453.1 alpha/beta hydrolase [Halomonas sp. SS10-MC5]
MSEAQQWSLAGGRLAALVWGREDAPTWLALHGWLDNAASFSRLAPRLVERLGIRIVALDFAGHGHSAHREGDYALWDYCHDLLDATDELGLERVPLLAHSMGAGVACLTAAALPERVERLVLIDGLGAVTTPVGESAAQLRKGLRAARRPRSVAPRYPDSRTAIAARVAGGVTPIDSATATPLVERNLVREPDGHVRLRTDGRLLWPSPVRLSPEQALALLGAIQAPVLLIEGESGILGEREMARAAREAVPQLVRRVLPGGHHLHLEPGWVSCVADAIETWLVAAEPA